MKFLTTSVIICFILSGYLHAQTLPKTDEEILRSLEHNLAYLSDDRMEGRLMGSRGEKLAYEFISENFQSLNLRTKGEQGYLQPFTIKRLTFKNCSLAIKNKSGEFNFETIKPNIAYPLEFSGVGEANASCAWVGFGIEAATENYNDYVGRKNIKGKIFIAKHGYPDYNNKQSKLAPFASIENKLIAAINNGAAALVIVNSDNQILEPDFKPIIRQKNINKIPVYFLTTNTKTDSITFVNAKASVMVDTATIEIKAHNVLGYIDYKADNTIVIGAHYDHLGYNELGGSTYRKQQNEPLQIHNGADDNASGTVAIIELAELIQKSPFRNHNYLFIAFSGEEQGLLGSKYFVENATIKLADVNYMINLDMVGRLDTTKNIFSISGTGTSPRWDSVLTKINANNLKVKYDPSGTGASDHTSFYNSGIPALHYFTGTHSDYHKPSDDWELVNLKGTLKIIKHIYSLIGLLDNQSKLPFTKTKETHSGNASPFKVTLGIMPDYLFEGKGVKIDGTTPGKPAANAGIEKGDVLIKLGNIDIIDMETYMQSLGKFEKGQKVNAVYLRNGKQLETEVTF